ncbi:hypothetical protein [Streptosporangium sp. NPDC002524]|uniref:hypothetical protein n=1 Tax=Streptosporangium sp. NPDC002524 TaxID=3154537 RepID=UPI00331989F2
MADALAGRAMRHGWTPLFPQRHPHAGGERHYAAYLKDTDLKDVDLKDTDGPEVELVALETSRQD